MGRKKQITKIEDLPIGMFPTSKVVIEQCPVDIPNGEDNALASIPLSKLMQNNSIVCPLCGRLLGTDTKEVMIDGQIYHCCKKQCIKLDV